MNELNNKLDGLSELVTRIDAKVLEINTKLEELITALHEYDDDQLHCEYSGLPSVKAYDEPLQGPCSKHDAEQWNEERMDIIGQNGNEGSHYVSNEEADEDAATFNDYGMRVVKDKDKSNNSANTRVEEKLIGGYGVPNNVKTGVDKKRNNELPNFKHTPPPPKPKRRYYKPKNK
jgi:Fe-S-cluster formation regulator IscX/YfhJ